MSDSVARDFEVHLFDPDNLPEDDLFFEYRLSLGGDILLTDRNAPDTSVRVGLWAGLYVDLASAIKDRADLMATVDDVDQAFFDICCALYTQNFHRFNRSVTRATGRRVRSPNLLYIDYIGLFPDYVGRGIGRQALDQIIQQHRHDAEILALEAVPLQFGHLDFLGSDYAQAMKTNPLDPDRQRATEKLKSAYADYGCHPISGEGDYFVKDIAV